LWTPNGAWWRLPRFLEHYTAGKLQRNPATGKIKRNPVTGKLIRNTATNTKCCCGGCSAFDAWPASVTIAVADTLSCDPYVLNAGTWDLPLFSGGAGYDHAYYKNDTVVSFTWSGLPVTGYWSAQLNTDNGGAVLPRPLLLTTCWLTWGDIYHAFSCSASPFCAETDGPTTVPTQCSLSYTMDAS
jgi:hypothetical protein